MQFWLYLGSLQTLRGELQPLGLGWDLNTPKSQTQSSRTRHWLCISSASSSHSSARAGNILLGI